MPYRITVWQYTPATSNSPAKTTILITNEIRVGLTPNAVWLEAVAQLKCGNKELPVAELNAEIVPLTAHFRGA
jgi:hypothetical protein